MKGIYTSITKIRRQVFAEVARLAFENGDHNQFEDAPYRILPGEVAQYRDSIFKERAIVGERLRLAMGLPIRKVDKHSRLSSGIEKVDVDYRILEAPLVNVIPFACEACPTDAFYVTDNCRKCLAHPCTFVCPVNAVSIGKIGQLFNRGNVFDSANAKKPAPINRLSANIVPVPRLVGVIPFKVTY